MLSFEKSAFATSKRALNHG